MVFFVECYFNRAKYNYDRYTCSFTIRFNPAAPVDRSDLPSMGVYFSRPWSSCRLLHKRFTIPDDDEDVEYLLLMIIIELLTYIYWLSLAYFKFEFIFLWSVKFKIIFYGSILMWPRAEINTKFICFVYISLLIHISRKNQLYKTLYLKWFSHIEPLCWCQSVQYCKVWCFEGSLLHSLGDIMLDVQTFRRMSTTSVN